MPANRWSKKRERQYEHIKASARKRGASTDRAQEIAAATVNKQRQEAGETVPEQKRKRARHTKRKSRVPPLDKKGARGDDNKSRRGKPPRTAKSARRSPPKTKPKPTGKRATKRAAKRRSAGG